jgi:hypothetical protein
MSDGITRAEAQRIHASAEARRAYVEVFADGDEYVVRDEDGQVTFRADNPFGLDSMLTEAGWPEPRNLYLIREEDA